MTMWCIGRCFGVLGDAIEGPDPGAGAIDLVGGEAGAAAGGVIVLDGEAGAAAGGADPPGVDGVIVPCAQTGPATARAAAIATPFKRCFMFLSSVAVLDSTLRGNSVLNPRAALASLRPVTTEMMVRSRRMPPRRVSGPAGAG
jgi:hypothetical protein